MNARPHPLLDHIHHTYRIKTDAVLSKLLKVSPPVISKIRHGRLKVTPTFILSVHETFGMPVADIRRIAANEVNQEKSA